MADIFHFQTTVCTQEHVRVREREVLNPQMMKTEEAKGFGLKKNVKDNTLKLSRAVCE